MKIGKLVLALSLLFIKPIWALAGPPQQQAVVLKADTNSSVPPDGTIFIIELGPQTYTCTFYADSCPFVVDSFALYTGLGACIYPKTLPAQRQCNIYFVWLDVKQSKRRIVGIH